MTPTSRPSYPRLAPWFACCALVLLSAAVPGAATELGEPYLVRDVDTTGEPFYVECNITCPPPVPIYGSLIEQLTPLGDLLVFVANDRVHGFEPWVSDGTAEGTRLLVDACPGDCFDLAPQLVGELDGRLYFWSAHPESGGARLWSTDGTREGTRPLDELCPGLCGVGAEGPGVAFDGSLFFQVYSAEQSRRFLWRTDGTPAGTEPVLPVCTRPNVCYERFENFFVFRGRLFFNDWADLRRLGRSDGEPAVAWAGTPASAAPLGDRMLLGVNDSLPSLWVLDGPLAEPRLVTHLDAGSRISRMTAAGGLVYFVLSRDQTAELWRTDGTAAGTRVEGGYAVGRGVDVVGALGESPIVRVHPDPGQLPVVLPTLLRVDPEGGAEPLTYLPVQQVAVVGERVFFSAEDGTIGRELWVSDGTGAGTVLVADVAPGVASSEPGLGGLVAPGFASAGGRLFFPAFHPDVDIELWALDLSTEGEPPPPPPPPPSVEWLEAPEVPGFRVQVRITGGGSSLFGRQEAACIPETLCVSGAVPGRSEVFVRVVGPKPNGFLWPTLVKFSTSTVEVWIEQEATEVVRYYLLEGAAPGFDVLPGLFDRTGFQP